LTRSQPSHWLWQDPVDVCHIYLSEKILANVAVDVVGRSMTEVTLRDILSFEDPIITRLVEAFQHEAVTGGVGGAIYAEAVGTQLAVHLLRNYAEIQFRRQAPGRRLSPEQQKRTLEYIERHLDQSLTLDEIAREAGLGTWTFGRMFRETFGRPPHAYITERRVERAEIFLHRGVMTIKEIAYACGFADQAHMTRVFRAMRNATPGSLRMIHKDT
jgi:AraC family transcriptional regulator